MYKKNYNYLQDPELALEIMLDQVCSQLQLNPTREQRLIKAYQTVSQIIDNDEIFFNDLDPLIYAYGSYALGTTTKPYKKDEYDLDWIVRVKPRFHHWSLERMLDELYRLLEEDGRYKGKVTRLRFCIRINYEGDFHMDIMPGRLIDENSERIEVADTKKGIWVSRNAKGYIHWFESLYINDIPKIRLQEYYEWKADIRAEVEELPKPQSYQYTQPLQRAIQLLKRFRDIYFENQPELKTSSVILTTIMGRFYTGETSIAETIDGCVSRISKFISEHGIIEITNPADDQLPKAEQEKFSDKWHEGEKGRKRYKAFLEFIQSFHQLWDNLTKNHGKPDQLLTKLFGQKVTENAFANRVKLTNALESRGKLIINPESVSFSGISTINSFSKPTSTFHGGTFNKNQNLASKVIPLSKQKDLILKMYPSWQVQTNKGILVAKGIIKPDVWSHEYLVKISFSRNGLIPKVKLLNPEIQKREGKYPPHLYSDKSLCLYYPKFKEWLPIMPIARTIIPWTMFWLFHYEHWLMTGDWLGGGTIDNKRFKVTSIEKPAMGF